MTEENNQVNELPLCACGCGKHVLHPKSKYLRTHHGVCKHPELHDSPTNLVQPFTAATDMNQPTPEVIKQPKALKDKFEKFAQGVAALPANVKIKPDKLREIVLAAGYADQIGSCAQGYSLMKRKDIIERIAEIRKELNVTQVDQKEVTLRRLYQIRDNPKSSNIDIIQASKEIGELLNWHRQKEIGGLIPVQLIFERYNKPSQKTIEVKEVTEEKK